MVATWEEKEFCTMPAKSEAQRRFIYGVKGKKFAEEHHFDNAGKLPPKVKKPKKKKGKKK